MFRVKLVSQELLLNNRNEVADLIQLVYTSNINKCDPNVGSDEEESKTTHIEVS